MRTRRIDDALLSTGLLLPLLLAMAAEAARVPAVIGNSTGSSCKQRGYTLCSDVRFKESVEAACCLEANAVCCMDSSLSSGMAQRFFCCPSALPVCDYGKLGLPTCRAVNHTAARVSDTEEKQALRRARKRVPDRAYQGTNLVHASAVLNRHLRASVERHGHDADVRLKACAGTTLPELHRLQRAMFAMIVPSLDAVYQQQHDNRRLQKRTLAEHEGAWAAELVLARQSPALGAILRDGRCHEAVMWWAHHLGLSQQKALLETGLQTEARSPLSLPLLPEVRHFGTGAAAAAADLDEVDPDVVSAVRKVYTNSVGCGACHVKSLPSQVRNGTVCPPSVHNGCMGQLRLHCISSSSSNSNSSKQRQCCAGLVCQPVFIPASDTSFSINTTICAASGDDLEPGDGTTVFAGSGAPAAEPRTAPIMPTSWRANGTYFNHTADDPTAPAGSVRFLFNQNGAGGFAAVRVDFSPVCPFKQLYKRGLESNYGPCSVILRNGTTTYAYHDQRVMCNYCDEDGIGPWNKDFMCAGSNLVPNVTISFNGTKSMTVDMWRYEWFSTFLAFRNIRNWYFLPGSNIPVRVAEDFDTGHTDFTNVETFPPPGIPDDAFLAGTADETEFFINGLHGNKEGCPGPDQRKPLKRDDIPECVIVAGGYPRKAWPVGNNER